MFLWDSLVDFTRAIEFEVSFLGFTGVLEDQMMAMDLPALTVMALWKY